MAKLSLALVGCVLVGTGDLTYRNPRRLRSEDDDVASRHRVEERPPVGGPDADRLCALVRPVTVELVTNLFIAGAGRVGTAHFAIVVADGDEAFADEGCL